MGFIAELRRRQVIKTTSYYLGVAWMVIGACDIFFPMLGINQSVMTSVIWVLVGGIPFVATLSWFVDMNRAGVSLDVGGDAPSQTKRNPTDLVVVAFLIVLLATSIAINLRQGDLLTDSTPLIAVFPFEDLSEVGNHITHGLADELVNLLVREPNLRLVAFETATSLVLTGNDMISAARELDADYIVRGTVRAQGDEFRVNLRVIDVESGEVTWSDQSTGALQDVFSAQYLMASRLTDSLNIAIEYAFASGHGVVSTVAVDSYLHAQQTVRAHGSLDKLNEARLALEGVLLLEPEFLIAASSLCSVAMNIFTRTEDPQDYRSGQQICQRSVEIDPGAVRSRLALAALHHQAGEYQQAYDLASAVTRSHPNLAPAYTQKASSAWRLGNLDTAEITFRQAIAIQDRDWGGYLSLGNFYALNQRFTDAIAPFTRITELNPTDFIGWASLGVTHYEAGNFLQARDFILRSLTLNESSRSYFNLGLVYAALGQPEDAAGAFADAVRLNPKNYRAQMFVASSLAKVGDMQGAATADERAFKIVEELAQINPNDAYVLANGATLLARLNKPDRAITWAEDARRANQTDPKVQLNIGLVYYEIGRIEQAIDELVTAIQFGYPRDLFFNGDIEPEILAHPKILGAFED